MNNNEYTIMLIFPKGDESVKGMKALYVFANYKPEIRYRYIPKDQYIESFKESCRKAIFKHKEEFPDLAHGYRCVITKLSIDEIKKYGEPIFICLDRENPDRTMNLTVEEISQINSKHLRELKYEDEKIKKAKTNKPTMHQKYNRKMASKR